MEKATEARDETKKNPKAETGKIRNATKRLERVKAKARTLSNADLHEVVMLRMADMKASEVKKKPKEKG